MNSIMELWKDLAERAVEEGLKYGADYVEARVEGAQISALTMRNGNVESVTMASSIGIGVRVIVNGGMAFLSIDRRDKELLSDEIKKGCRLAFNIGRKNIRSIKLSRSQAYNDHAIAHQKIKMENVCLEEKIKYLKNLDEIAKLSAKRIKLPARLITLNNTYSHKFIVTSEGTQIEIETPRISIFYLITGSYNGRTQQDMGQKGMTKGWEFTEEANVEDELKSNISAMDKSLREAVKPPKGKLDVILGGSIVGLASHESVGHPYEADRVLGREAAQAGESFITPKMLGTKIGSEIVTVVDDPTIPGSYGYYPYDDEGVKARPRYLLKNGVINELLHNRETAYYFKTESNAAARASGFNREPIIRMANTYMMPGDWDFDEMLEEIKLGVYIKRYMEWNIDDTRYNMRYVGSESYLIEDGKLTKMVSKPILELTTPKYYSSIDAVGKNLVFDAATCGKGDPMQPVPVWIGGPDVRLRDVILR